MQCIRNVEISHSKWAQRFRRTNSHSCCWRWLLARWGRCSHNFSCSKALNCTLKRVSLYISHILNVGLLRTQFSCRILFVNLLVILIWQQLSLSAPTIEKNSCEVKFDSHMRWNVPLVIARHASCGSFHRYNPCSSLSRHFSLSLDLNRFRRHTLYICIFPRFSSSFTSPEPDSSR